MPDASTHVTPTTGVGPKGWSYREWREWRARLGPVRIRGLSQRQTAFLVAVWAAWKFSADTASNRRIRVLTGIHAEEMFPIACSLAAKKLIVMQWENGGRWVRDLTIPTPLGEALVELGGGPHSALGLEAP